MQIVCPHCNQQLEAPREMGGKTANCVRCKGSFIVPPEPEEKPAGWGKIIYTIMLLLVMAASMAYFRHIADQRSWESMHKAENERAAKSIHAFDDQYAKQQKANWDAGQKLIKGILKNPPEQK